MFLPPLLFLRRPWQGGCGRHSRVPAGRDGTLVSTVGLLPRAPGGLDLGLLPGCEAGSHSGVYKWKCCPKPFGAREALPAVVLVLRRSRILGAVFSLTSACLCFQMVFPPVSVNCMEEKSASWSHA